MSSREPDYIVDPDDPRAPPTDVWKRMTREQQLRVLEALPSEFEPSSASPPEGDAHMNVVFEARDVLRGFFERSGRRVYVGNDLPVYYPRERMFAPDVIAVVDVATHQRERWSVDDEGKGLDLAIEVLVSGRRAKDLRDNVARYARLGITEYFVFDVPRQHLRGFRLPAGGGAYAPVLPQGGAYACEVLGLALTVQQGRLRFTISGAALPETRELFERANVELERALARAEAEASLREEESKRLEEETRKREEETRKREEETRRREEETRRREEETRRREEVEAKLEAALAEIARLKRGG